MPEDDVINYFEFLKQLEIKPKENAEHCYNRAMDEWEDENLPPENRRRARMISCPCKRCSPISF